MLRYQRATEFHRNPITSLGVICALVISSHLMAQQSAPTTGLRAYSLQHVDATAAATQIQKMITPGTGEVYIDPVKNQVIVKGDERTQQMASQMLTAIDRPASSPAAPKPPATENRVKGYQVAPAQVEAIAAELARRFPATMGVRVVPDTRTSQVVVIGPAAVHQQVDNHNHLRPNRLDAL